MYITLRSTAETADATARETGHALGANIVKNDHRPELSGSRQLLANLQSERDAIDVRIAKVDATIARLAAVKAAAERVQAEHQADDERYANELRVWAATGVLTEESAVPAPSC